MKGYRICLLRKPMSNPCTSPKVARDYLQRIELIERYHSVEVSAASVYEACVLAWRNSGDAGSRRSVRADFARLVIRDDGLVGNHVPSQQRLSHRIDLIVVRAVRKRGTSSMR